MSDQHKTSLTKQVFGYLICVGLIGAAALFTYDAPMTVLRFHRPDDNNQQVNVEVGHYLLGLYPLAEFDLQSVTAVSGSDESKYEGYLSLTHAEGTYDVPTESGTDTLKTKVNIFLQSRGQQELVVRVFPRLVLVCFLGGIGALFTLAMMAGQIYVLLRLFLPHEPNINLLSDPDSPIPPDIRGDLRPLVNFTRVVEWQPGVHYRFTRSTLNWIVVVFLSMIGAVVGATALSSFFGLWGALAGSVLGFVAFLIFLQAKIPYRNVDIDLKNRSVQWQIGRRYGSASLKQIRRIVVQGLSSTQEDETEYRGSLRLVVRQDRVETEVEILDTDEWKSDESASLVPLGALGSAIAAELNVPCEVGNTKPEPTVWQELAARPFSLPSLTVAAGFLAVVAMIGGYGYQLYQQSVERGVIAAAGGDFVSSASKSSRNLIVYHRVAQVTFAELDDQRLAKVLVPLQRYRRLALEISRSRLTPQGLAQLQGNEAIISLIIPGITDDHAELISTMPNLVELAAGDSQLTPVGLEKLSRLKKLRFLYVRSRHIDANALPVLKRFSGLNQLRIAAGISTAAEEELKKSLTATKIDVFRF